MAMPSSKRRTRHNAQVDADRCRQEPRIYDYLYPPAEEIANPVAPVLLRGFCQRWEAMHILEKDDFFNQIEDAQSHLFHVKVSRDGRSSVPCFAEARIKKMTFPDFLKVYSDEKADNVYYMNAYGEDKDMRKDSPFFSLRELGEIIPNPQWSDRLMEPEHESFHDCSKAMAEKGLQFVNMAFWFSGRTVSTPLHFDEYLTMTSVMGSGTKTWYVAAPSASSLLRIKFKGHRSHTSTFQPWVEGADNAMMKHFHKLEVRTGDLLIMPSKWWHAVVSDGRCIGINWWFVYPDKLAENAQQMMLAERHGAINQWMCGVCGYKNDKSHWKKHDHDAQ